MKRAKSATSAAQTKDTRLPPPSYDVGYGRPPRQHQFRSGQSGNPEGRPKGTKNAVTILRDILNAKIDVRAGGTIRKMSVIEAMLTRIADAALKGDTKAAAFLLQRYELIDRAQDQAGGTPTSDDQEIIDAYFETHLKKQRASECRS
jgi:hypothetical protein